jgi:hypothetical protein
MKSCIATFHLRSKAMSYTSDDGDNMKTCKDYLNEMVSNDDIFIQANQNLSKAAWHIPSLVPARGQSSMHKQERSQLNKHE